MHIIIQLARLIDPKIIPNSISEHLFFKIFLPDLQHQHMCFTQQGLCAPSALNIAKPLVVAFHTFLLHGRIYLTGSERLYLVPQPARYASVRYAMHCIVHQRKVKYSENGLLWQKTVMFHKMDFIQQVFHSIPFCRIIARYLISRSMFCVRHCEGSRAEGI